MSDRSQEYREVPPQAYDKIVGAARLGILTLAALGIAGALYGISRLDGLSHPDGRDQ